MFFLKSFCQAFFQKPPEKKLVLIQITYLFHKNYYYFKVFNIAHILKHNWKNKFIVQGYIYNASIPVSVDVRLQQNENQISHFHFTHQVKWGSIWRKNRCNKVENVNKTFWNLMFICYGEINFSHGILILLQVMSSRQSKGIRLDCDLIA
jgi:hypothetical protein